MKKQLAKGFTKLGLLVIVTMLGAVATANAQTLEYKLTVNIPFDFTVANKKLPAGEYFIHRAQQSAGDLVLEIANAKGSSTLSRLTFPVTTAKPQKQGSVVFHRYGNEYFLSQVWPAGGQTGRALPKSRSEREAARQGQDLVGMATLKAGKAETVTIVANLQ